MSKNAHYSFDPIIVPGIILQQRLQFYFFFFILNLIFAGRKKKKKMEKTQIRSGDLDYYWTMNAAVAEVSGPKGIFCPSDVHSLFPEVFLGQSLCMGGHLPCSL